MSRKTTTKVLTCKMCGRKVVPTSNNVKKEWIGRGYNGDYQTYVFTCPYCNNKQEVSVFCLPFKIVWRILKKRWSKRF